MRLSRTLLVPAALALLAVAAGVSALVAGMAPTTPQRTTPDEALASLRAGNERFASGHADHPRADADRRRLAAGADQGQHAYATVIACSDSRVPVEMIFDAGVMDLFVVRVAGNVCDTDEVGSIEYGLAHVNTPVLVVLGHTGCGAVTAVTQAHQGRGHRLERSIPPLVDNIMPAVARAAAARPDLEGDDLIPLAIEENVWQGIEDLFLRSPAVRSLAAAGRVKVVGGIYDLGSGRINWLPEQQVGAILERASADPRRETVQFAD